MSQEQSTAISLIITGRTCVLNRGGNAIFDGKQYHIYVSAMANHCPLSTWGRNSRIDHGVSDTITGPYTLKDVAIPTWSHNSAPIALKDGTYVACLNSDPWVGVKMPCTTVML